VPEKQRLCLVRRQSAQDLTGRFQNPRRGAPLGDNRESEVAQRLCRIKLQICSLIEKRAEAIRRLVEKPLVPKEVFLGRVLIG
jgi:hypothetical protein